MNLKKNFSLICLSVCFLSAFAQEIDIESLYRSSGLPTGNALLAAGPVSGGKTDKATLQSDVFWGITIMNWSISNTGDKGTPWLLPTGSKALPYQRTGQFTFAPSAEISVGSKAELKALLGAYHPHKVKLTNDINFEGDTINTLFEIGSFDGQGYTISNFVLQKHPSFEEYGFFYRVDSVLNLTLAIKEFTHTGTTSRVGILIGHLPSSSVLRNCHVKPYLSSSITVTGVDSVGGLVGYSEGLIYGCTVRGINVVASKTCAGGMVGFSTNITKNSSVAKVSVRANFQGSSFAGGLIGNLGPNATITDCNVDSSKVYGYELAGGLAGNSTNSATTITGCKVDSVVVTAEHKHAGGLFGANFATITNCSASRVVVSNTMTDTDSRNIGGLIGFAISGDVSNCSVKNIDAKGHQYIGGLVGYNEGSKISYCTVDTATIAGYQFSGGLTGQNKKDLYHNTISNVTVTTTISLAGGLVGDNAGNSKVVGCRVYGANITAGTTQAGGLIGFNQAVIDSCLVARVRVKSTGSDNPTFVGGLIGQNTENEIKNSKVDSAFVSGIARVGGLVGCNKGPVSSCKVDSATVSGTDFIGGLVGHIEAACTLATDTVINSKITATNYSVGGLLGGNNDLAITVTVTNCVARLDTVQGVGYVGGLVGRLYGSVSGGSADRMYITGNGSVGGIVGVGEASSNISNVSAKHILVKGYDSPAENIGGIVGVLRGNVTSCKVDDATVSGSNYIGGLVGYIAAACTLTTDTVINSKIKASSNYAGGLVGADVSTTNKVTVTNCVTRLDSVSGISCVGGFVGKLYGKVSGGSADSMYIDASGNTNSWVGGIVGSGEDATTDISSVSAKHISVTALGLYAGGITGWTKGAVTSCRVDSSSVRGKSQVGGVVGQSVAGSAITTCSVDSVNVYGSGGDIGGIIGYSLSNVITGIVNNSIITSSNASANAGGSVGGIAGVNEGYIYGSIVRGCKVDLYVAPAAVGYGSGGIAGLNKPDKNIDESMVTGTEITLHNGTGEYKGCGGIVGHAESGGTINKCLVKGNTNINGMSYVGGIVGVANLGGTTIKNNHVHNSTIYSATDGTHMGGIAGFFYGTAEYNLITNSVIKCDATTPNGSRIGGVIGYTSSSTFTTTLTNNVAMLKYFEVKTKYQKSPSNLDHARFGRIYTYTGTQPSISKNWGWVETYIKYYHKRYGVNWGSTYYRGTSAVGDAERNGNNLYAGDVKTNESNRSVDPGFWGGKGFATTYWNTENINDLKFPELLVFKDSIKNAGTRLVSDRGYEYSLKIEEGFSVTYGANKKITATNLMIFNPYLFLLEYRYTWCLWTTATKVDLYTDILLETASGDGSEMTFWAIDPNQGQDGNMCHWLIHSESNPFEFDGHGYSIDGYYNKYTSDDYGMSSLISYVPNCKYTVKRLEVDNFRRHFVLASNTDQRFFGTLIDKVDSSSTFEDIYIKSPYIAIDDDEYNGDFDYLGGLVGQITKGTVNFTRVAAYMSVGPTLYTKHKGYLGGIVGYVGGGSVSLNNVATCLTANFYTRPNTSSSQGFYIGYKETGISAPYSRFWFSGTLGSDFDNSKSVPLDRVVTSTLNFYQALGSGNAELQGKPNWHIPTTTADIDSIYLVRDPLPVSY